MAGLGAVNLCLLDPASLNVRFLPSILSQSSRGRPEVSWDRHNPSAEWVSALWAWQQVSCAVHEAWWLLVGVDLLPCQNERVPECLVLLWVVWDH